MRQFNISFLLLSFLMGAPAFSKTFTSQFTQFELPAGWECNLEGSEWVCQSDNKQRRREAIIILAAKVRGKQDSLDDYLLHLKQAKPFTLPGGKKQVSEPKYAKRNTINGHPWVDALHLASEVPGFFTRYLATVKGNLGVAVTFSVAKDMYGQYKELFDQVIATLKVFATEQEVTKFANTGGVKSKGLDGELIEDPFGGDISISQKAAKKNGGGSSEILIYVLAAAAVGGFVLMKKKKGAKKPGSKK